MNTEKKDFYQPEIEELEAKNKHAQMLKFCIINSCKSQLSKDYLKVFSL